MLMNFSTSLPTNGQDASFMYYMSFFSRLAYATDRGKDAFTQDRLQLASLQFERVGGTHAPQFCIIRAFGVQIVCIAGTSEINQWMSYVIEAGMQNVTGGTGRVFGPFNLWSEQITNASDAGLLRVLPTYLCGHSLGGAMAIIVGDKLRRRDFDIRGIWTYGCPRVGDEAFSVAVQTKVTNVRRRDDPVPQLPPPVNFLGAFGNRDNATVPQLFRPGTDHVLPGREEPRVNPFDFSWIGGLFTRPAASAVRTLTHHLVDGYVRDVWSTLHPFEQRYNQVWRYVTIALWNIGLSSNV